MKVTINIPFTYEIGETGFHTGKTLETVEDCKAEVIAEIESGVLTEDEPYMEVEKPKPDFSQREITLLRLALHAYANLPTVTATEREELNVIRLKLLEIELGVNKEKSILKLNAMSIHEAREALDNGHKVTHRYFTDNEYLVKGEHGKGILAEDGYRIDWYLYLNTPDVYGDGWSIFEG